MAAKLNPLLKKQLLRYSHPRLAEIAALSDHYDELTELNDLAYGITKPGSDVDWTDAPVYVNGVRLRALSIGASQWVSQKAWSWFDPERQTFWANIAVAYAMSHSRAPSRLHKIRDAASCKTALKSWLNNCGCTYAELVDAIESILHSQDQSQEPESSSPSEYGPVIALLCSEYTMEPDDVLWKLSTDRVQGLCDEYVAKLRAQEAAQKGKGHRPSSPAYIKACGRFMVGLKKFRERIEADNG